MRIKESLSIKATQPFHLKLIQTQSDIFSHKHNINSRVAPKKPFLSPVNQKNCLELAHQHQAWNLSDYKWVIWTEESSFEVGEQF